MSAYSNCFQRALHSNIIHFLFDCQGLHDPLRIGRWISDLIGLQIEECARR